MKIKNLFPCLFVLVLACLLFVALADKYIQPPSVPPQVASRPVIASSLDVSEQWRLPVGFSCSLHFPPPFWVASGKAIFYTTEFLTNRNRYWLWAVSLENGEVAWKEQIPERINSYYVDGGRIFMVIDYKVSAYALEDGQLLWQTEELGDHQEYYFRPWDPGSPLKLYDYRPRQVIQIDPDTGRILSLSPNYPLLLQYKDFDFIDDIDQRHDHVVQVKERNSPNILWERSILWMQKMQPNFVGDDLIFTDADAFYYFTRVDLRAGKQVWETPKKYVSNYALAGARLYILDQSGALAALDINSGNEIGRVEFGPPIPQNRGHNPFCVAAGEGYVLAYYGDSQELVAFRENDVKTP